MDLDCVSQYKNCVKGIPCGNTCISKGKNCKPKPNAQINAVANLLADSDEITPLSDLFDDLGFSDFFDDLGDLGIGAPPSGYTGWKSEQEAKSNESLAQKLNSNAPPPTEEQAKAINIYTGSMYKDINGLLRGSKQFGDPEYEQKVQNVADQAAAGLRSLPNYKDETYRGTLLNNNIVDNLKVGGTYSDKGFLSTSSSKDVADNFSDSKKTGSTPVFFTIEGKYGKDISQASKFTGEKEILFNPSSKFKITNIEEKEGVLYVGMKQYGKQK